jgi:hypothetical protein
VFILVGGNIITDRGYCPVCNLDMREEYEGSS